MFEKVDKYLIMQNLLWMVSKNPVFYMWERKPQRLLHIV